jgi:hypothetical protein
VINLSAATLQSSCHNGYLAPRRRSRLPFHSTTAASSHRGRQATERVTAERRSAPSKWPSNSSTQLLNNNQRHLLIVISLLNSSTDATNIGRSATPGGWLRIVLE